jgi:dolichol-phosphate mannosyltransferase
MPTQNQFREIKKVIIVPTFNETQSIENLLSNLVPRCSSQIAIVICDDSGPTLNKFYKSLASRFSTVDGPSVIVDFSNEKNGRGHAVLRGFKKSLIDYPKAIFFLECDADESHRVEDIMMILNHDPKSEFVIGSRYLQQSQIKGWPMSRRIFSKSLNLIIPFMLGLQTSDATNGLRRYSKRAVVTILSSPIKTSGFIVLSEFALILKKHNTVPEDLPTIFINRKLGSSTVTYRELLSSAIGLIKLIILDNAQY